MKLARTSSGVRQNERGTSFKEATDESRSLAWDRRPKAERVVPAGQGDCGAGLAEGSLPVAVAGADAILDGFLRRTRLAKAAFYQAPSG